LAKGEFSDTSTATGYREKSGRRGLKKWATTEITFKRGGNFLNTERLSKKS